MLKLHIEAASALGRQLIVQRGWADLGSSLLEKIPPHVLDLFELMRGGELNLEDGRAVRKYMITYKDDRMMNEVTSHVTKMRKLVVHMTMSGVFDSSR